MNVKLLPSEIFFSQDSISNKFGKNTDHRNKFIGETLDDILLGKCSIYDTGLRISVKRKEGKWVTADNRRLWIFKQLHRFRKCGKIVVNIISYLDPRKDCIQSTIRIRQGGFAGGCYWINLEKKLNPESSFVQRYQSVEDIAFSARGCVSLELSTTRDTHEVQSFCDSDTSNLRVFPSGDTILSNDYREQNEKKSILFSEEPFAVPRNSAVYTQCTNNNRSNNTKRQTSPCSDSETLSYQEPPKYSFPIEKTFSGQHKSMPNPKITTAVSQSQDISTTALAMVSFDDHLAILHSKYGKESKKYLSSEKSNEVKRVSSCVLKQHFPQKELQSSSSLNAATGVVRPSSVNYNKTHKDSLSTSRTVEISLRESITSEKVTSFRHKTVGTKVRSLESNTFAKPDTSKCDTFGTVDYPEEYASLQGKGKPFLVKSSEPVIYLNPLDIKFAGNIYLSPSEGKILGELLDDYMNSTSSRTFHIQVFKHQKKIYSKEALKLLLLQMLHRLFCYVQFSGTIIPRPTEIPLYQLHDSVKSLHGISGHKWKSFSTLNDLPTKKRVNVSLSNIYYTKNPITSMFKERSITKELIEVFNCGMCSHELNILDYENKFYTLENKRLWVLKHAEKVLGKFTITGNVKILMDDIMFHNLITIKDKETVDVQLVMSDLHTDEEKFILKYIHRMEKPSE